MNAIEIKELKKTYPGFVLEDLNLTLPAGCIMGLIGENGAGKTTVIKLILGMISRDAGSIEVLGHDNSRKFADVRQDIGVVLDEAGFPWCMTARQVNRVMSGIYTRWDEKKFFEYIERFNIPTDKPFGDFSKGTKMKLCIAAAISHDPKLLILDEPTAGLDPVARDEVVDIFSEFTRDESHSILISSHIVSDLEKLCDYIAFIHRGKLMLCEEKDMLLAEYGIIRGEAEKLRKIDPTAVKGLKENAYGASAIVKRSAAPAGFEISPVSIEELFLFMVKEA